VEQAEYTKEGVSVSEVDFVNNEPTLALLEAKGGVFSHIDDEIKVPRGSDGTMLSKLVAAHGGAGGKGGHASFARAHPRAKNSQLSFVVRHFAGDVCYDTTGFLEKDKDALQVGACYSAVSVSLTEHALQPDFVANYTITHPHCSPTSWPCWTPPPAPS
jgi:myosin heavy subunit